MEQTTQNADYAKDIRLFSMKDWLIKKQRRILAVVNRNLSIDDFTLYLGLSMTFNSAVYDTLSSFGTLKKCSPVVILDEPTTALDPVAEYELYRQFHSLIGGKTAIYISHRLSSCRFCDHIAVFSGGRIAEYGFLILLSHNHLCYIKRLD